MAFWREKIEKRLLSFWRQKIENRNYDPHIFVKTEVKIKILDTIFVKISLKIINFELTFVILASNNTKSLIVLFVKFKIFVRPEDKPLRDWWDKREP